MLGVSWEQWKILSRGGMSPDLDVHRCPLALVGEQSVGVKSRSWGTREEATALVQVINTGVGAGR